MVRIAYENPRLSENSLLVIEKANEIIDIYQEQGFSLTLRQLYYQFVARALIPNTERSYKNLGAIISKGRRAGLIDWDAIEDRTRQLREHTSWSDPEAILKAARDSYHRDLWLYQPYRIEVWVEKEALTGVIEGVCTELDVPYFACKGYVSDSEMWNAAIRMRRWVSKHEQKVVVIYLGDHDPSGIDMTRDIEDRIQLFAVDSSWITVKRIALTEEQIEELNPPPNPAKVTDSRYEKYRSLYGDESWELDALEPQYISDLITEHVDEYRDMEIWLEAYSQQENEREIIDRAIGWAMLNDD